MYKLALWFQDGYPNREIEYEIFTTHTMWRAVYELDGL